MISEDVRLFSHLTPARCSSRLQEAIDLERSALLSLSCFGGTKPVAGFATETSFRLRKRNSYGRGSLCFLTGVMRPEAGGTAVSGQTTPTPITRVAYYFWLAIVFFFFGPMLIITSVVTFFGGDTGLGFKLMGTPIYFFPIGNAWPGIVTPIIMFAFAYAIHRYTHFLSWEEHRFLVAFLKEQFDARDQPAQDRLELPGA